jgi:hypothetical protein
MLLSILESVISTKDDDGYLKLTITDPARLKKLMLFSTLWAFGGFLDGDGRSQLSQLLCKQHAAIPPSDRGESMLFNYMVDVQTGEWLNWEDKVEHYHFPTG